MTDKPDQIVEVNSTPGWIAPAIVALLVMSVAGVGYAWYDSNQIRSTQEAFTDQMNSAAQNDTHLVAALQEKESQDEATNAQLQSDLGVVTKRLRVTQADLKTARDEAAQIRDNDAQQLAQMDTDVKNQLSTKASTDDLNATNGTVSGVKSDLEGTKTDLTMARGELGTLIARNHDEIDSLRRMGERDYVEFTIQGRNKPQKIGNVTVSLRSVNTKKNQFTVSLIDNDIATDKRDRTVNEPIIFYPNGTHEADELVVNQVGKDKIAGYISMPKSGTSTSASIGGN